MVRCSMAFVNSSILLLHYISSTWSPALLDSYIGQALGHQYWNSAMRQAPASMNFKNAAQRDIGHHFLRAEGWPMDWKSLSSPTEICLKPLSGGIKPMRALAQSAAACRRRARWFYTRTQERGAIRVACRLFLPTKLCLALLCFLNFFFIRLSLFKSPKSCFFHSLFLLLLLFSPLLIFSFFQNLFYIIQHISFPLLVLFNIIYLHNFIPKCSTFPLSKYYAQQELLIRYILYLLILTHQHLIKTFFLTFYQQKPVKIN